MEKSTDWKKRLEIPLAVLGFMLAMITTFSGLGLCQRIFTLSLIVSLIGVLLAWLRLSHKLDNRPPLGTISPPMQYLFQNARGQLVAGFVFAIIVIVSLFLSLFPEAANGLPICATLTPAPTQTVTPAPTLTPNPTRLPTLTPTASPTSTLTPTASPPPCPLVDDMDSILGWLPYVAPNSESHWANPQMPLALSPGLRGQAILLQFYVPQGGWVGMSRDITGGLPSGTSGIQFSYFADSLKDIELKLFKRGEGYDILCDVDIPSQPGIGAWRTEQVPFSKLKCSDGKPITPQEVIRIDFGLSVRRFGQPGAGEVIIDGIWTMCQ